MTTAEKYMLRKGYSHMDRNPLELQFCREFFSLQQEVPSKARPRKTVGVQIFGFDEDTAYCQARIDIEKESRWLPVHLKRNSLEACDLRIGDYFEWVPNEEGIVRNEDITQHPRRYGREDVEASEKAFKLLREEWPKEESGY
jgi:hypothetical protein